MKMETLESHVEVVSALEYHQSMAIKHTDEADRHIALGIEEYIAAGEHLIEVKARMDYGEYRAWVEREYGRSWTQAKAYKRLAVHKAQVLEEQGRRDGPLSLNAALKMLAAPKDEPFGNDEGGDNESDNQSGADLEAVHQQAEQDALEKQRQELEAREQVVAGLEAEKERLDKQQEVIRAEREKVDEMAETLEERISRLDRQYQDAIAFLKAKYNDEEPPEFAEISDEAWAEAFATAKSARVMEAAKRLNEIYGGWPRWMGEYLPGEAAAAITDMDHAPALTEALRYVIDWLGRVVREVEARRS